MVADTDVMLIKVLLSTEAYIEKGSKLYEIA